MSFLPAEPLIAADNTFALGAVIAVLVWFGFWLDGQWLGRRTSSVVWVILAGTALSNLRIVPFEAPAYGFVFTYLVPLAIPLLLFKGDLRKIWRDGGPVMLAFAIASAGTITGALVGFVLLDLGDIGAQVAGVYTGGWIGGAVNFVAVAEAVGLTGDDFTVALGASAIVSITALMALILLPSIALVRRLVPSAIMTGADTVRTDDAGAAAPLSFKLAHVSGGLAASFVICASAYTLAGALGADQYAILIITVITIAVVNLFPNVMTNIEGDFELGMLLIYAFFASVGIGTNALSFIETAPVLFFYGMCILVVHLALVLAFARLAKIDLAVAIAGSGAALVGPQVTAALVSARGWKTLVTPAIMCGVLGYVIATFVGVALTTALS